MFVWSLSYFGTLYQLRVCLVSQDEKMIMYTDLEMTGEDVVMAHFQVVPAFHLEEIRKVTRNPLRIAGVLHEIQTGYLQNRSLDFYRYINPPGNKWKVRDVAMKFPELFYCSHTCILTAYWGGHLWSTPLEQLCT